MRAIRLVCGLVAFGFSSMAFTYQFGANPQIDYIRLLVSDTVDLNHVFEDSELLAFYQIQQLTWQSSMRYSDTGGTYLPTSPVSYLRVAALALDSLAANKARLSSITQLLDVKLDPSKAAKALSDQAKAYREVDDDSGAFAIIEMVHDQWSFQDRWWSQVQRQAGGTLV